MPITTVIIISLLLANLALTLIMFWIIHDLLEVTKSLQDSEDLFEKYNKCLAGVYDREKDLRKELIDIYSSYEKMYEQYKLITDMQTKLLECWKGCEERYSQSYELFKHCSDNLKEVSYQLTDLANVSTEDEYTLTLNEACDTVCIECPFGGSKCNDCPVWKIQHGNEDEGDDNIEKD